MNRYSNIKKVKLGNGDIRSKGTTYYSKTPKYPEIPFKSDDIYVITDASDRISNLANQFYNDVTLYWIISTANPNALSLGSDFPPNGSQLRIPRDISSVIDDYNKLNSL